MSLRIDTIPNRNSHPQILLRQSWREGNRIRHKTIINLTNLPKTIIHAIDATLKGGVVIDSIDKTVTIKRSLPHGHVAAILGVAKQLQLPRLLDRSKSRTSTLALAAIIMRLIDPASRLATARQLSPESATTSVGRQLDLDQVSGNEMLDMLGWLHKRQPSIERALAKRHLCDGTVLLYDVSSSYVEGKCCDLAEYGYNRDGKRGKRQIVYGLLCSAEGCPIAIEVFSGNTADPPTVASQVMRVRSRFKIDQVVLVGDRGMLTTARINEDLKPNDLDWVSALTSKDVRKLLSHDSSQDGSTQSVDGLKPDQVVEVLSPDFPDERLMVCLNPRRREDRVRTRNELLTSTEAVLNKIADQSQQKKPGKANRDWINRALGRDANKWKVLKHFHIEAQEDGLRFSRNLKSIDDEARLDGIFVIRTSLDKQQSSAHEVVQTYKSLARVERAFRSIKTARLHIRPIYVYRENQVRGLVFLCMLAYYVEWHLRRKLAPLLFDDDDKVSAESKRASPVAKAQLSDRAKRKADTKKTPDGHSVMSMPNMIAHLGTLTLNQVSLHNQPESQFMMTTKPTEIQSRAFELLQLSEPQKVFTVN